jgi:hypothetical protein
MRTVCLGRVGWLLTGTLLAGFGTAAAQNAAPQPAALEMPNLSGKWYLNKDASELPDSSASRESGGGSGSGYHGGGGGMGRHGGGGGHHGRGSQPSNDGGQASDDGSSMQELVMRLQVLDIRHEEPKISITDAGGRERVLFTDGRKLEEEHSYGGTTKVITRWKDGRVEVVSTPEHGPKMTETYAITADHTQLTVTTTLQGGRRDVTIRRVYQTTPPAATAPAAPSASPGGTKTAPAQPDPDPAEDAVV